MRRFGGGLAIFDDRHDRALVLPLLWGTKANEVPTKQSCIVTAKARSRRAEDAIVAMIFYGYFEQLVSVNEDDDVTRKKRTCLLRTVREDQYRMYVLWWYSKVYEARVSCIF